MMNLLPPIVPVNPDSSNTIAKVEAIAGAELGGRFEFYRLETCGVPVCECDTLTLYFQSLENSRLNFSLKIQVMSFKFEAKSNNRSLAEKIGKELTVDDTREFIGIQAYGKSEQFKKLDVKNLGIDKQGEKALLADLEGLIPLNYTFPWAPGIVYENEKGRTVTVIDSY